MSDREDKFDKPNSGKPSEDGLLSEDEHRLEEYERGYKTGRAADFKLDLNSEIGRIPNYERVRRVKKTRYRMSTFAKIMFALVVVCLSVILSLCILFAVQDVFGIGKEDKTLLVEVEQNAGVTQIAEMLQDAGVIKSEFLFRAYYKLTKAEANFQYGAYELRSTMSYDAILSELQKYSATRKEVSVMFKEGITLYQMADLLEINKVCSAENFINTVNNTDFGYAFEEKLGKNAYRFHKLEGYLFPDTYNFYENDNPVNVAKKFLDNTNKRVFEGLKTQISGMTITQEELMTVASIVQMEAGNEENMRKVASVYLNRLNNPGDYGRLQADPTRDYADELKLQMQIIDQDILDAYNTYEGLGLPPGPICNPGITAVKAVLNPEDTDYFYFCTNLDTGEFYYAKTLEEHNVNVQKAGLRQ